MNRLHAPSRWVPAVLACCAGLARAQDPSPSAPPFAIGARVIIIDEQLASRELSLLSIDERHVTIVDEQSQQRNLARSNVLAIISDTSERPGGLAPPTSTPILTGMIELIDGQRLPGDLLSTARAEDAVAWNHPAFGKVSFQIDRVRGFARRSATLDIREQAFRDSDPPPNDLLFLTNGDQQAGYLVSTGDPIRIEVDGAPLDIDPDRVAGARLSNVREPAEGAWIWLTDGTAARVTRLNLDTAGRSSFALLDGPTGSIPWDQVRAVLLDAGRVVPLSHLELNSQSPATDRRYAPPVRQVSNNTESDPAALVGPPMGAADLLLPGPMTISWSLPPSATRIAFEAALAPGAIPWGDCELVITIDHVEQTRRRLYPDQESVTINVPVSGRELSIAVEPGRFGPIRDWVILKRGLILIAGSATERAD